MNWNNYKNRYPHPSKEEFRLYNVYRLGKILGERVSRFEKENILIDNPGAVEEKFFDESGYSAARNAYSNDDQRIISDFWMDFAQENDISVEHPKFALLQKVAWDLGHSSGLKEVYNYALDLVEFLK